MKMRFETWAVFGALPLDKGEPFGTVESTGIYVVDDQIHARVPGADNKVMAKQTKRLVQFVWRN